MNTHDEITGLLSSSSFDKLLDCEWKLAQRHGTPLSLALIEIDRFSTFKDEYGPAAADECLRFVASAMSSYFPNVGAAVAHLGDGMFAALIPRTEPAAASLVAEASASEIGRVPVEYAGAKCARVTASTGVASADRGSGFHRGPATLRFQAEAGLRLARATRASRAARALPALPERGSEPMVA